MDTIRLLEEGLGILFVPQSLNRVDIAHREEASWHGAVRGEGKDNVSEDVRILKDDHTNAEILSIVLVECVASGGLRNVFPSDLSDEDLLLLCKFFFNVHLTLFKGDI